MKIEIRPTKEETILVFTPYNGDYVKRIKALGNARWDANEKAWELPDFMEDEVRKIISDIYGYDENGDVNTVDVKIIVKRELSGLREDVTLLGKCLCHASGRDSGGKSPSDVAYIKGKASSGGSVKNWRSIVPQGAELLLHDVSEKKYLELINSNNEILEDIELFLVEKPKKAVETVERDLEAERKIKEEKKKNAAKKLYAEVSNVYNLKMAEDGYDHNKGYDARKKAKYVSIKIATIGGEDVDSREFYFLEKLGYARHAVFYSKDVTYNNYKEELEKLAELGIEVRNDLTEDERNAILERISFYENFEENAAKVVLENIGERPVFEGSLEYFNQKDVWKWNGRFYGKAGKWRVYVDGVETFITDEEKEEIEKMLEKQEKWDKGRSTIRQAMWGGKTLTELDLRRIAKRVKK